MEEEVTIRRREQEENRKRITLFQAPLRTLHLFSVVCYRYTLSWIVFFGSQLVALGIFFFLLATMLVLYALPGSHQQYVSVLEQEVLIASWWILLGVLSSIGLGTGLHTFVLYLGPFIAKVTMAATECNSLNFDTYGPNSFICPAVPTDDVTLFGILRKVQFAALLWGCGTAIGELPPYFVARAARLAGQQMEELQELQEAGEAESFVSRIATNVKKLMFKALGNLGFFGILAMASIPNPLFDLAGITCGHFLVPFSVFFGATLIGKGLIKSHLQTVFVITMFSKKLMSYWIETVEYFVPFLKGSIDDFLEKQKAQFHRHSGEIIADQKSILATLWDMVLICMLLYFMISIVNSSVHGYLLERDEEELAKLRESKKAQ